MLTNTSIGRYGRFGNQLYQVAALCAIARRSGQPWALPRWVNHDHVERFGSTEDVNIWDRLTNPLPELPVPCNLVFTPKWVPWGYHDVTFPNGNFDLSGHFQSPRYFDFCIDEVRRVLSFKDTSSQMDAIAVHMRCGDYTDGAETYHPRMTADYYREAFKHVPDVPVLLFSDDIMTAERVIRNATGRPFESVVGRHYVDDFIAMRQCKYHIISNSSYSAMAATLADQPDKKVVAPRLWFGAAAGGLSGADIYEKNWIII